MKFASIFYSGMSDKISCSVIKAKDLESAYEEADQITSNFESATVFPLTNTNKKSLRFFLGQ